MKDSIIKNTGNSRYLKSAISAATTWEQFRAALIAGTLPIDLNGINTAGWQQVGDALNKANLLPDGIITAFGLPGSNPQVKDGISRLPWHKIQEWTTAGSYTWTAPDLFNGRDYTIGVMVIGGGAGGTAGASYVGDGAEVSGGPSGRSNYAVVKVSPNSNHTLVIGAGGAGATVNRDSSGQSFSRGGNGGTTSFDGALSALGGGYSTLPTQANSFGGQLPCYSISADTASLNFFGGVTISGLVNRYYSGDTSAMTMDIMSCYNPFEHRRILGAGGFAISNSSSRVSGVGGKDPLTGLGATDGVATKIQTSGAAVVSGAPTAPGCGGGGAACYSSTAGTAASATSGAGADGAVMIYVMGVEA